MFTKVRMGSGDSTLGCAQAIYYVLWRSCPNQPWRSEELLHRFEAHNKYFSLIQRGYEAYLEKRQRTLLPA
jgi:hypothetical protein